MLIRIQLAHSSQSQAVQKGKHLLDSSMVPCFLVSEKECAAIHAALFHPHAARAISTVHGLFWHVPPRWDGCETSMPPGHRLHYAVRPHLISEAEPVASHSTKDHGAPGGHDTASMPEMQLDEFLWLLQDHRCMPELVPEAASPSASGIQLGPEPS